jgi:hypothetical protein
VTLGVRLSKHSVVARGEVKPGPHHNVYATTLREALKSGWTSPDVHRGRIYNCADSEGGSIAEVVEDRFELVESVVRGVCAWIPSAFTRCQSVERPFAPVSVRLVSVGLHHGSHIHVQVFMDQGESGVLWVDVAQNGANHLGYLTSHNDSPTGCLIARLPLDSPNENHYAGNDTTFRPADLRSAMLTAGAARSLIDPPLPNDPQGYVRRETPALEHGDPLQITGVVLEHGDTVVAILAADLTGYDRVMAARIRNEVGLAIGCDASAVLLNASHSHAAPWARADDAKLGGGYDTYTPGERAYVDRLPYDFASVALRAWRAREPARVAGGTGRVPGVAVNRRERTADGRTILGWNPDLTIDEDVPTIRIDSVDGAPIATITAFGCHPVVVGPELGKTGTDFVGPLRRRVEEIRGGGVCVFLQGAAGNVLPLEAFFDHEGPEHAMGGRLGLEAAHAIADADPLNREIVKIDFGSVTPISLYRKVALNEQPDQAVGFARRMVELPMLAPLSKAELEAELAERTAQLRSEVAQGATRAVTNPIRYHVNWLTSMLAHGHALDTWTSSPGEVWAMRVGDCAIVGTPGEVFSEIGQAVRSASPFSTTLFAGYCQGILGYVATPEEYPHGGYEPAVAHRGYGHPAPFAPEAAQMLIDASLNLLTGLYGERG